MKYIDRDDGSVIPVRLKDSGLTNLRPGCTFCFRRKILEKFSVMDINTLHDSMLWKYAIVSDSLYLLNRQLIYYRRHEHVSTGAYIAPVADVIKARNTDGEVQMYMDFINHADELEIKPEYCELMRKRIDFLYRRKKVLDKKNLFSTSLFVLRNMKYYPTLRNALSDIYAVLFLK